MNYRLGKHPARNTAKLKLGDYLDLSKLPAPPDDFGHELLVPDWKMLGNDNAGDCAVAGPYHAIMLWDAEANKTVNVDTDTAIKTYSKISGYNPATGENDDGCNVEEVAHLWQTKGLADADGNTHKISCYAALEPGNWEQLKYAAYLFDGVGIGVNFPQEWMTAFSNGQFWDALPNPHYDGGHYILGTGFRGAFLNVVTWGKTQLITQAGYEENNDETFVYFTEEKLINGVDIDGFKRDDLINDLRELANKPLYAPVKEKPFDLVEFYKSIRDDSSE